MSQLEPLPFVHHPTGMRCSAVRYPDCCPPQPMGCRWCGLPSTGHARQYGRSGKSHLWTAPTQAQIRLRMETRRRAARAVASGRCNGVTHSSIGSCVIEDPGPAAVLVEKPTRCDGMAHNGIGSEMHCVNENPDHREDHDDGDGNTWPVQPEEREGVPAPAPEAAVVDNCRCFDAPGHDAACHKSKVTYEGVAYSAVHWHLDGTQDWWQPYGIDDDGQLTFLADGDPWATPKPLGELIARYGPLTGTEYGVEVARQDLPRTEP